MSRAPDNIFVSKSGTGHLFTHMEHPNRFYFGFISFLLLQSLDSVWMAFAFKVLLDSMSVGNRLLVTRWALVFLVLGALSSCLNWLSFGFRAKSAERLAKNLRTALLENVLKMPLLRSDRLSRGDLSSRLTADVNTSSQIPNQIYLLTRRILSAVFAASFMIYLNWQVALATAITSPLIVFVSGLLSKPVTGRSASLQKDIGNGASQATNLMEGAAVIKSFSAESWAEERFAQKAENMRKSSVGLERTVALSNAWAQSGSLLPFLVAFGYGGYMTVHGRLTVGGIMALVNLCNNLGWPLSEVGKQVSDIKRSLGAFSRISEILREEQEPSISKAICEDTRIPEAPGVVANCLSFEYTPGITVLSCVSFEIAPGSLVVIVGRSGCGKSTLLKLLAGLYRPEPKTVYVGGRDLHYAPAEWVRNVAAYVPQEPFLFAGSLRENLSLAQPGVSDERIRAALDEADASLFVHGDSIGLDLKVSERGESLSGGQRQRIAIARTLLRGGALLLVDEPTGFLDEQSEERVWNSLRPALKTRTCIAATHRLDIAKDAYLILVMENGKIVEQGTHEDLLADGILYPDLFKNSLGAAL